MLKLRILNKKTYVNQAYVVRGLDDKPLGLYDLYPIGDLCGAKVHEAINHNTAAVRKAVDTQLIKLDGDAIKYLVDREFDHLNRNRRPNYVR